MKFKEKDIRPKKIFNEFLHLASLDIKKYFGKAKNKINCVACNQKGQFSFKKMNFSYCECKNCNTLFVSPRPHEKAFLNYYTSSPSIKFLATHLYKKTEKVRKNKIIKPKAKIIFDFLKKNKKTNYTCVDIGGGYGIFAKEISRLLKRKSVVIEPSPNLAHVCKKKGLIVIQKFLEEVKKKDLPPVKKIFTCFELFEHLHNPSKFIKNLKQIMQKGDLFFFTTLSSTGIDILTLWENSRSINPPHHLNFFNPRSIEIFLKKNNFKILNISTPGKIDINILKNDQQFIKDRFWKNFILNSNEVEKNKMQNLISSINFSSHLMVVCQK